MKWVRVLTLVMVVGGSAGFSQSDSSLPPPHGLVPPPAMQLRTELTLAPATLQPPRSLFDATRPAEQMSLGTQVSPRDLERFERLERAGYLTAPAPKSEHPFARSLDAIFEPEVIRIGKTTVACSIVTAIKRKNPLCLLSPMFFNFSW